MVLYAVKVNNYAYIDHRAQFSHAIMKLAILLCRKNWEQSEELLGCTTKEGAIGFLLLVATYVKNQYFRTVVL